MKRKFLATATSAILTISAGGFALEAKAETESYYGVQGFYVNESVEVSNHHVFPDGPEVDGATILIRDFRNKIVRMDVTTAALEPDTAYSIWLAVFNSPDQCAGPGQCAPSDLGNPDVRASVFWGGGLIADANGYASTTMTLQPGRTNRELFAIPSDLGLQDIRNAEIHVVLRSHGPTGVAGSVASQIGTANEACPGGNPMNCVNAFASVHSPD
jgi:hypothetical protein